MKKIKKSELAAARDAWFSSAEGKRCLDMGGLKSHNAEKYLRNRLECAFLAGSKSSSAPTVARDLDTVQKAMDAEGEMWIELQCEYGSPMAFNDTQSLLAWAKQTIGVE